MAAGVAGGRLHLETLSRACIYPDYGFPPLMCATRGMHTCTYALAHMHMHKCTHAHMHMHKHAQIIDDALASGVHGACSPPHVPHTCPTHPSPHSYGGNTHTRAKPAPFQLAQRGAQKRARYHRFDCQTISQARHIGKRRSRRVFPTACAAHVSYAPVPALTRGEHAVTLTRAKPALNLPPFSIGANGRPKGHNTRNHSSDSQTVFEAHT